MTRGSAAGLDLAGATPALRDRFWHKVDQRGPNECWPWTWYRVSRGYGLFRLQRGGKHVIASRVAFALEHGPLVVGDFVCHRCDNPPCCNPAHLFKGTQVDNINDCVSKGRANRVYGESHPHARLTEDLVRQIRAGTAYGDEAGDLRRFADSLGVATKTIYHARIGHTWKHVR